MALCRRGTAAGRGRAHLAEPADTAKERGRKQRAKTDRTDAALLRELLAMGRLPESWIPPEHVLEVRARVRLYKALADERRAWLQRIRATLVPPRGPRPRLSPRRRRRPGPSRSGPTSAPRGVNRSKSPSARSSVSTPSSPALRCDLVALATTRSGAGPSRVTTGSGPSCRWRSGRNSGTAGGSVPRRPPCATPVSTSRCGPRTPSAPGHLLPPGPRHLALGPLRGRLIGGQAQLPDHDYFLSVKEPRRASSGPPFRSAQAHPALLPHPAQPRRRRLRSGRMITPPRDRGACRRCCRRLPRCYCRRGFALGRPERTERRQPPPGVPHPSSCDRSSDSAHQAKSGRPTATRDQRAAPPLPPPRGIAVD